MNGIRQKGVNDLGKIILSNSVKEWQIGKKGGCQEFISCYDFLVSKQKYFFNGKTPFLSKSHPPFLVWMQSMALPSSA